MLLKTMFDTLHAFMACYYCEACQCLAAAGKAGLYLHFPLYEPAADGGSSGAIQKSPPSLEIFTNK